MLALVGGNKRNGKLQVLDTDDFSVEEIDNYKFIEFIRTTRIQVEGIPLLNYIMSTTDPIRLLYKKGKAHLDEECIVFFGWGIGTDDSFTRITNKDKDIIVYSRDGFKSDYNFYFCGYLVSVSFSRIDDYKYFVPVKQGSNRFCIRFYGDRTINCLVKTLIGITVSQDEYKLDGYAEGRAKVIRCSLQNVNKHMLLDNNGGM